MSGGSNFSRRAVIGSLATLVAAKAIAAEPVQSSDRVLIKLPARSANATTDDGAVAFLGIRYGQDTKDRRFQPAAPTRDRIPQLRFAIDENQPEAALASFRTAFGEDVVVERSAFGPVSPQQGSRYVPQSEDCLFLNVWTPNHYVRQPRPVMVYIHGGAYSNGSVTDPLNDGAALAERGDVVVVTVNHRLNAFGYLSLGRIDPRFPDSGNVGQLDLILGLQWVQRNIAAFGGDPHNVTVFGQSGGGAKIATLMAMPAAKGLFHKAITMSGQQVTASGPLNAEKRARAYLARLGFDPVTAPVEALVAALDTVDPVMGGGLYFGPVLDRRNLLRHPFWPDAAPQGNSIPMMMGNCIAETRAFFPPDHPKLRGLDWSNIAARMGPELRVDIDPEMVVRTYGGWYPDLSPADIFIKATTAGRSWRGQVIEAEERAKAGVPAFVYQLDFEQAMHTGDIGLVFGTKPDMTPAQQAMSDRMMAAFVRFARTGNPGWPAYDLTARKTMVFDTDSRVESNPRGRERALFGVVPYIQPGT
ncbi:carboxylesterase/lipase family protein [Sphingomonas sp. SUN039]|uniref:carboxylesterase/lipase family protein n=1 Tax=Sphingomonas sp. SUN039 TaxID=2937787 RepID=UPI0021647885|nr:carboxylesterase family protein [Sphingomonas sp. SUN039]UVO54145.1 carboxylesterase family protein [Sphingomonas sp. SUN039]